MDIVLVELVVVCFFIKKRTDLVGQIVFLNGFNVFVHDCDYYDPLACAWGTVQLCTPGYHITMCSECGCDTACK